MSTIDNIQFNNCIYGHATNWSLLLYQLNGISVVIPLPNANIMPFIRVFNDVIQCQNLIVRNPHKTITLFAYENNIHQWLTNNINMPSNLQNINIFCHSDDYLYVTDWTNRHRHRFNNIIFHIIAFEHLNYNLLLFGLDHIQRLRREFQDDFGILNLLDQDYQKICDSLGNDALERANIEEERIRRSQEAQN